MWRPKNLVEALLPVFLLNSLFGHGVIQYSKINKSYIVYNFIYSIFTLISYIACLILVIHYYVETSWMLSYKITYFIIFSNTFIMIFNVILGWIYRKRNYVINRNSIKIEETLSALGEPVDAQGEFWYSLAASICWIITSVLLNYNKLAWFNLDIGLHRKIALILVTQHPHYINFLIDLTFCLSIKHVKTRLKSLNRVLLNTFISDGYFRNYINSGILLSARKKSNRDKWAICKPEHKDLIKIFQTIKYLHLELGILCREFTKTYGIQLILSIISSFGFITHTLLYLYFVIVTESLISHDKILQTFGAVISVATTGFKIIFVTKICSETILEWQQTGELIHKLEIETKNIELKKEIQQFSIQILQNPLIFSPCGLVDLGYPFLRDFVGSLTAQLIILIQTSDESSILYVSYNKTTVIDA